VQKSTGFLRTYPFQLFSEYLVREFPVVSVSKLRLWSPTDTSSAQDLGATTHGRGARMLSSGLLFMLVSASSIASMKDSLRFSRRSKRLISSSTGSRWRRVTVSFVPRPACFCRVLLFSTRSASQWMRKPTSARTLVTSGALLPPKRPWAPPSRTVPPRSPRHIFPPEWASTHHRFSSVACTPSSFPTYSSVTWLTSNRSTFLLVPLRSLRPDHRH